MSSIEENAIAVDQTTEERNLTGTGGDSQYGSTNSGTRTAGTRTSVTQGEEISFAVCLLFLFLIILERTAFFVVTLNVYPISLHLIGYGERVAAFVSLLFSGLSKILVFPFGYALDQKLRDPCAMLVTGFFSYVISLSVLSFATSLTEVTYARLYNESISGNISWFSRPYNESISGNISWFSRPYNESISGNISWFSLSVERLQFPYLYFIGLCCLSLSSAAVQALLIPMTLCAFESSRSKLKILSDIEFVTHAAYGLINVGAFTASVFNILLKSFGKLHLVALAFVIVCLILVLFPNNRLYRNFLRERDRRPVIGFSEARMDESAESSNISVSDEQNRALIKRFLWILLGLLPYEVAQSQVISSFIEQTRHLDIYQNMSCHDWDVVKNATRLPVVVPLSRLNLLNSISVGVATVFAWVWLECNRRRGRCCTAPIRIWWATLLAFIALLAALVVELSRRFKAAVKLACLFISQRFQVVSYSNVLFYVVIPQFVLIGLSEAIGGAASMEMFLSMTGKQRLSTSFGFYNLVGGLGKILGAGFLLIEQQCGFYFNSSSNAVLPIPMKETTSKIDSADIKTHWFYGQLVFLVFLRLLFVSFFKPRRDSDAAAIQ